MSLNERKNGGMILADFGKQIGTITRLAMGYKQYNILGMRFKAELYGDIW